MLNIIVTITVFIKCGADDKVHDWAWSKGRNWQWINNGSTMDWEWSQTEKRKSSWQNGPTMYFAQCRTPIQSPVQRKITTNLFSRKSKFVFPNSSQADPGVLACSNPRQPLPPLRETHSPTTSQGKIPTCRHSWWPTTTTHNPRTATHNPGQESSHRIVRVMLSVLVILEQC